MTSDISVPQDLHIHTVFSTGDSAVVPQQTVQLVADVAHARVLGISDHIEFVSGEDFSSYCEAVRANGLYLGVEVSSARWAEEALNLNVDYYIYHCANSAEQYRGAERLVSSSKPVIIAHPMMMETDLNRIPPQCLVEVNNRYVWQYDWHKGLGPFVGSHRFVIGSDAHRPNWLNQNLARYVAAKLGIVETVLFPENKPIVL